MLPAIAFAAISLAAAFAILNPQNAIGEVGVVFPPWASQAQVHAAVIRAGGRIAGSSRWPNAIVAYVSDPGFYARVRNQGAWFAVAASALCAPPEKPDQWREFDDA